MKALFIFIAVSLGSLTGLTQGFWITTRDFPGGPKTAFAGVQDSILVVGTARGIWRSENEGFSWTKALSSSYIYCLHASGTDTLLAGGKGKLFFSYDKGITWDSVSVTTSYPIVKIVENNDQEYFFISSGFTNEDGFVGDGVFYNNGDLRNWEKRVTGLPPHLLSVEQLAIDKNGRIYITLPDENTTGQGGLYYSNNDGLNWQQSPLFVTNLGTIKVLNSSGISITPEDSVVVSVTGTAVNISTRLNMIKHINDVENSSAWRPWRIRKTGNWWDDITLNTIHFSKRGDWYSSFSSTVSTGGVFLSEDKGINWIKRTQGVGLSITDRYENSLYYESTAGKIFMVQLLDERAYYTNHSLLNPILLSGTIRDDQGKALMGCTILAKNNLTSTDSQGNFSIVVPTGWSGNLIPSKSNFTFSPESVSITNAQEANVNINFIGTYVGTYFISGYVRTISGQPIPGISVTGFPENVYTNEYGYYLAELPARWSGTIMPTQTGYETNPTSITVTELKSDLINQDFTLRKQGVLYIIGRVLDENQSPFLDATLTGFPETTRIDATGNFYGELPVGWSGTIIPVAEGYQFTPEKIQVTNLQSDLINRVFIASQVVTGHLLSGFVTDLSGAPLSNVSIIGLPNELKTAADGSYRVELPKGWTGVITPVSDEYTFNPSSITITSLSASLSNQNFTGSIVTGVVDENLSNNIYPNPTRDGLIHLRAQPEMRVRIWNSTGQMIWQGDSKDLSINEFQLPQAGIYFVSITDKANKMQTIKVLFQ